MDYLHKKLQQREINTKNRPERNENKESTQSDGEKGEDLYDPQKMALGRRTETMGR